MKYFVAAAAVAVGLLVLGGCGGYTRGMHDRYAEEDSSLAPAMTIQDVIDLAKSGVSDTVIIMQIRATHARFSLSSNDIISLKTAGVSEQVINAMIQSGSGPRHRGGYYSDDYDGYNYPDGYYYPYYYPYDYYYPNYYFGLGFGWPYYGFGYYYPGFRHHYGGFPYRYGVGHGSRTFGTNRGSGYVVRPNGTPPRGGSYAPRSSGNSGTRGGAVRSGGGGSSRAGRSGGRR